MGSNWRIFRIWPNLTDSYFTYSRFLDSQWSRWHDSQQEMSYSWQRQLASSSSHTTSDSHSPSKRTNKHHTKHQHTKAAVQIIPNESYLAAIRNKANAEVADDKADATVSMCVLMHVHIIVELGRASKLSTSSQSLILTKIKTAKTRQLIVAIIAHIPHNATTTFSSLASSSIFTPCINREHCAIHELRVVRWIRWICVRCWILWSWIPCVPRWRENPTLRWEVQVLDPAHSRYRRLRGHSH